MIRLDAPPPKQRHSIMVSCWPRAGGPFVAASLQPPCNHAKKKEEAGTHKPRTKRRREAPLSFFFTFLFLSSGTEPPTDGDDGQA